MSALKVSVILIVWNGMRFLPDCLRTLCADLQNISHEVIAVDNGSTDDSAEFIAKQMPSARLVRHKTNLGFARAVNAGMTMSAGECILLLNQDTRIRPGAIGALLGRIEQDSAIGVIGPKFVSFEGRTQQSARAFPGMRHVWYDALLLSRLFPRHREYGSWRMGWFDHEHEREVDQPMGAAMMIRGEAVERMGMFDESFPIFFNDVDFCRRVKAAGYKLVYFPSAVVEHYVGGSTRQSPWKMKWESHASMFWYLAKYAKWYQMPMLWLTGVVLVVGVLPAMVLPRRGGVQGQIDR